MPDHAADDALHLVVIDNREHDRFEARTADGTFAGFAAYRRNGARVVLTHTVVTDELEGHGVGSSLAAHALDAVRAAGERAVIVCPFVKTFVARHHEFDDLLEPVRPGDLEFDD
jgi:hypothetical protein